MDLLGLRLVVAVGARTIVRSSCSQRGPAMAWIWTQVLAVASPALLPTELSAYISPCTFLEHGRPLPPRSNCPLNGTGCENGGVCHNSCEGKFCSCPSRATGGTCENCKHTTNMSCIRTCHEDYCPVSLVAQYNPYWVIGCSIECIAIAIGPLPGQIQRSATIVFHHGWISFSVKFLRFIWNTMCPKVGGDPWSKYSKWVHDSSKLCLPRVQYLLSKMSRVCTWVLAPDRGVLSTNKYSLDRHMIAASN